MHSYEKSYRTYNDDAPLLKLSVQTAAEQSDRNEQLHSTLVTVPLMIHMIFWLLSRPGTSPFRNTQLRMQPREPILPGNPS